MRESLGVKPKGAMKVSGAPPSGERPAGRMGPRTITRRSPALPGRLVLITSGDAPGAHTLVPERW